MIIYTWYDEMYTVFFFYFLLLLLLLAYILNFARCVRVSEAPPLCCHFCIFKTQQTIVSSRGTRVHDCGVRRAAMGCRGLSRLSLRVAAGVNCASVLGDCHHFNAPPQSSRECSTSERSPLLGWSSLSSELCFTSQRVESPLQFRKPLHVRKKHHHKPLHFKKNYCWS